MSTTPPLPVITVDDSGVLKPKNLDEAIRLAEGYFRAGMLPDRYKSASMVLFAMQKAFELGLPPLLAMENMACVKGKWMVYNELPLGMVQKSGKMEWMKEVWIDADGKEINLENKNLASKPWGAVCRTKRKGDAEVAEAFFTMDDAQAAGLLNIASGKQPGPWHTYPKRMLRMRARGQALKDKFADALMGMPVTDDDDFQEAINVTPTKTSVLTAEIGRDDGPASSLAEKLRAKAEVVEGETI